MIDDRENNEYTDGREDAPPGETGKTEAPYEGGPDDLQSSPPRRMSTGVKVLIGCGVAFGGLVLIVSILISLVAPTLLKGRGEAWKIQCSNNLKQIYFAAQAYAAKESSFPRDKSVDDPPAHGSLNILLRSPQGRSLEPELFKCPASEASIAQVNEDEKFQLDEDTLDYAWALKETRNTHTVPLAACEHHEGILIVLFTDSQIEFWELDDPEVEDKIDEETGLPRGLGR